MKYLLLSILLLLSPVTDINKIARTNELKKEAKAAFLAGNYEEAIAKYHFLIDTMQVDEEGIRMNLANAYYQHRDTTSAITYYNQLSDSEDIKLASRAYQQLGVIKNKQKRKEEALSDFKQALRKDPSNEEARFNYELLKKLLDEQKEQEQQQKDNKDKKEDQEQQQKQDNQQQNEQEQDQQDQEQKQDQQSKEGEEQEKQEQQQKDEQQKKGEEEQQKKEGEPKEPSDEENDNQQQQNDMNISPDKLKEMNISEEKARMILEAMKNQEIQYLQQNKRKSQQRPSSGKPDW